MALNITEMRTKAEAGSCVAQGVLGTCLLYGIEVGIDYAEAFRWLSAASEQRASRPTLHLAYMHQQGLGTPVNPQQAIKLFTAVATPSDSTDAFAARIELGRIFRHGLGLPADEAEAAKWYLAALAVAADDDEVQKVEEARNFTAPRSELITGQPERTRGGVDGRSAGPTGPGGRPSTNNGKFLTRASAP